MSFKAGIMIYYSQKKTEKKNTVISEKDMLVLGLGI